MPLGLGGAAWKDGCGVRAGMMGAIVATGLAAMVPAAAAALPPPLWQNIAQVNVLCLVETENGVENGMLRERICQAARTAAAEGAPVPVVAIGLGDPAILRHDMVTLLVHGSARPAEGGRLFAVSVRPYRNDGNDPGQLFTGAPRAALYRGDEDRALTRLVREGVRAALPWN